MQNNSFWGSIPPLDNLKSIRYLDLSHNNLSGQIPQNMVNLPSLLNLNLSFNNLEGALPLKGIFQNATGVHVLGNSKLCGGIQDLHLEPCFVRPHGKPKKRTTLKLILVIVSVVSCLALLSSFLSFCWAKKLKNRPHSASSGRQFYPKISYEDLLNATSGFSSSNLIGSGSFGTVYKGSLALDATVVAVKVLKLQQRGASKSFIAECEALRNIRHRNLVKVLSACSSITFEGNEFKAIVYQYMPNGSLEDWLHPKAEQVQHKNLSILQRLNIAGDVASALDYLHHQCQTPVVHCDLKPSNVLLDEDLTAHLSDFGLARLLSNSSEDVNLNQFSSLGINGTIGYAAPEYGMGGEVTTQGDVYSFGVLLLEMFTGRRPTDELFKDDVNLHNFVKMALPDQVMEIVDQSALYGEEEEDAIEEVEFGSKWTHEQTEHLISVFRIGVACSEDSPPSRMNMNKVAMDLLSVRDKFI